MAQEVIGEFNENLLDEDLSDTNTNKYEDFLLYDVEEIDEALKGENYKDVCFDLDEPDLELKNLSNEVLKTYVMEQISKQSIYGVQFQQGFRTKKWYISYSKYRSPDTIIEGGYFSPEEKALIYTENENLIWEIVHKYEPNPNAYSSYTKEDIYEGCLIGFTEALNNYNSKDIKVKFSTYAYNSMVNRCRDIIKGSFVRGQKDTFVLSLDVKYEQSGANGNVNDISSSNDYSGLSNLVHTNKHNEDYDNFINNDTLYDTLKLLMEGLDEDHIYVALHHFGILGEEKLTKMEMARELYVSAPKITKMISNIEKHLSDRVYELGLDPSDIF